MIRSGAPARERRRAIRDASGGVANCATADLSVYCFAPPNATRQPVRAPISSATVCPKKILFPIDFSDACTRVVHHAAALARHFDSEVTVLHVQSGDPSGRVKERLESYQQASLEGLPRKNVISKDDDPGRAILELARRERMDLIMMPTYGTGPFRKLLLGSVAEKVLQGADCPVWTNTHVENRLCCEKRAIRAIVCAVDRDASGRRVLAWARDFARMIGVTLTVVHATSPFHHAPENGWSEQLRRDAKAALCRRLDELGMRAAIHLEAGEVSTVVTMATKNLNADLLVIGRNTDVARFDSIETNTYSLIRHSNCPVISV